MTCFVRSTNAKSFGMTLEPMLRLIAGLFVTASVLLGIFVSPYFFWFTLFVGLNLMQSGATNWCLMMTFLKRLGVRRSAPAHEAFPDRPTVQPITR
jgi:DUF2892 family protein